MSSTFLEKQSLINQVSCVDGSEATVMSCLLVAGEARSYFQCYGDSYKQYVLALPPADPTRPTPASDQRPDLALLNRCVTCTVHNLRPSINVSSFRILLLSFFCYAREEMFKCEYK